MKKFSLWTTAFVAAVGMLVVSYTNAQEAATATAKEASAPHQIGLIDLAHIFKNYEKFKDQTTTLQEEAKAAEEKAQGMINEMKQLQAQIQSQQLQPGSPEYNALEAKLIELQNKLQTFRQVEQRDIVRKQAEVYKKIYLEVQNAVGQYAEYFNYTLIIRFNRQEVADALNPDSVIQSMNRQVVYYQQRDDLTDPILKYLNQQYKSTAAK